MLDYLDGCFWMPDSYQGFERLTMRTTSMLATVAKKPGMAAPA
ncbi:hypothetical protein [Cupriavidus basilensis]|nr:hypothetical protein [Cupriavidus basilensis]